MAANNPAKSGTQQIRSGNFDEQRATDAFKVHVALLDQERRHPELKENPAWQLIRADAYVGFVEAFGGEA